MVAGPVAAVVRGGYFCADIWGANCGLTGLMSSSEQGAGPITVVPREIGAFQLIFQFRSRQRLTHREVQRRDGGEP